MNLANNQSNHKRQGCQQSVMTKKDSVFFPPFYFWLSISFHLKSSLEIRISLYSLSHLDLTGVWQKPRIMSPNLLFNGLACEGLLTKWQTALLFSCGRTHVHKPWSLLWLQWNSSSFLNTWWTYSLTWHLIQFCFCFPLWGW